MIWRTLEPRRCFQQQRLFALHEARKRGRDLHGGHVAFLLERFDQLAERPEVAGRQWDYPSGYNLSTLPRVYEPVSFQTLRGLAEGYDLLRLVIETRKDQVARLTWTISARDKKSSDPRAAASTSTASRSRSSRWRSRRSCAGSPT